MREAFDGVAPASHLTDNRNVLLTRSGSGKGNTLYVHLYRDPEHSGVKLKPLAIAPRRATLLNTGGPVAWEIDMVPSEHADQTRCLRLRGLPVNEHANTVLVVKLEFEDLSALPVAPPVAPSDGAASDLLER